MGLIEVAGSVRPRLGERICGDAWVYREEGPVTFLAIVDGLGHGEDAGLAAEVAVTYLRDHAPLRAIPPELDCLLLGLHHTLHRTRGVVAGVAWIHSTAEVVFYAGIGNTEVRLISGEPSHLYSRAGLLGDGRHPRPIVQRAPFPPRALHILHSDGVGPVERRSISHAVSCAEIAHALLEQGARQDDDAAIVVARSKGVRDAARAPDGRV